MKVKSITPSKDRDQKDVWIVNFEEDSRSMWCPFLPSFSVGHIFEADKLQLSSTGKSWIFKKKQVASTEPPKSEPRKSYGKTPEEQASIERQVDKKNAVELYCHTTDAGIVLNEAYLVKCYNAAHSLGRNPAVEVAKKEYGAVEK